MNADNQRILPAALNTLKPGTTRVEFDYTALSLTAPIFKPTAPVPGGATPPNDGFFDASATYIGAVGTDDWTQGWTAYPQPTAP